MVNEKEYFYNIVHSALSNVNINDKSIIGFIDGESGIFSKMVEKLKAIGYIFSIRTSNKFSAGKLQFEHNMSEFPIEFFGVPFVKTRKLIYICEHGIKYQDSKKKSLAMDNISHNKRNRKDLCKAEIRVLQLEYFPDYKIEFTDNLSIRNEMMNKLKLNRALDSSSIRMKKRCYVYISLPDVHNHTIMAPVRNQKVSSSALVQKETYLAQVNKAVNSNSDILDVPHKHIENCATITNVQNEVTIGGTSVTNLTDKSIAELQEELRGLARCITDMSYIISNEEMLHRNIHVLKQYVNTVHAKLQQDSNTPFTPFLFPSEKPVVLKKKKLKPKRMKPNI